MSFSLACSYVSSQSSHGTPKGEGEGEGEGDYITFPPLVNPFLNFFFLSFPSAAWERQRKKKGPCRYEKRHQPLMNCRAQPSL